MKASEFYDTSKELHLTAETQAEQADRIAAFFRDKSRKIRELRDTVDDRGVTPESVARLETLQTEVANGPTELETTVSFAAEAEPARTRRERAPCPGKVGNLTCGKRRGHIPGCPEAARPAIRDRNAEERSLDGARVELAGQIRLLQTEGKALVPSDAAAELGVTIEDVRAAWPLLAGEKAP